MKTSAMRDPARAGLNLKCLDVRLSVTSEASDQGQLMILGQPFYFLLTMANHGLVEVERQQHGVHGPRYLNAAGRWAGNGRRVPLLVWKTREEAQSAATIATAYRKKTVTVAQRADSSWQLGKAIRFFTEADAAALQGYADGQ